MGRAERPGSPRMGVGAGVRGDGCRRCQPVRATALPAPPFGARMAATVFSLTARVSTDNPAAVRPVLDRLLPKASITEGEAKGEFRIVAEMTGSSARELNRHLLSEMRRVEKRTRLRSEWTAGVTTERFFDYVPKGSRSA